VGGGERRINGEGTIVKDTRIWQVADRIFGALRSPCPAVSPAVLVAGSSLRILLETKSEDEKILRVLIEQHRERVELYVATAELSKWPDAMGVFPDWKPGREPS
jgi:hypothetical protein